MIFTFDVDMFYVSVVYVEGPVEDLLMVLEDVGTLGNEDYSQGMTVILPDSENKPWQRLYIYVGDCDTGTMVHELSHAADAIFDERELDCGETRAYLIEHLYRVITYGREKSGTTKTDTDNTQGLRLVQR